MGIIEDCAEVIRNLLVVFDQALCEGAVVIETSGDVAGMDAVECAFEDGNFGG